MDIKKESMNKMCDEEVWHDFLSKTNEKQVASDFLENNIQLKYAERVLSIGPGTGQVDLDFLSILPNVQSYTGVEPDGAMRKLLQQNLLDLGKNLEVVLESDSIETYRGPEESVDVILMIHVCYYFKKTFASKIKRALQWLRPGGNLVLLHTEKSPFVTEIDELMTGESEPWGFDEAVRKLDIPFTEEEMKISFDCSPPGFASLVHFLTEKYPDAKQLEECLKIAERHCEDGESHVEGFQYAHVIPQMALQYLN